MCACILQSWRNCIKCITCVTVRAVTAVQGQGDMSICHMCMCVGTGTKKDRGIPRTRPTPNINKGGHCALLLQPPLGLLEVQAGLPRLASPRPLMQQRTLRPHAPEREDSPPHRLRVEQDALRSPQAARPPPRLAAHACAQLHAPAARAEPRRQLDGARHGAPPRAASLVRARALRPLTEAPGGLPPQL